MFRTTARKKKEPVGDKNLIAAIDVARKNTTLTRDQASGGFSFGNLFRPATAYGLHKHRTDLDNNGKPLKKGKKTPKIDERLK